LCQRSQRGSEHVFAVTIAAVDRGLGDPSAGGDRLDGDRPGPRLATIGAVFDTVGGDGQLIC
jgi:hypothetical protein